MADFVIPVDKCYTINSNPINKNTINHVIARYKPYSLEKTEIVNAEFNFWIMKSNEWASENSAYVIPSNFVDLGIETNTITGQLTLIQTQKTYDATRVSKVYKYSYVYTPELGIKGDIVINAIYTQTRNVNGDYYDFSYVENQTDGIAKASSYDQWTNYFKNVGVGAQSNSVYYVEYNKQNNTYTFYLAFEKEVTITCVFGNTTTLLKFQRNSKIIASANVYKLEEERTNERYAQTTEKNDNVYNINNELLTSKITLASYGLIIYNMLQILDKYSKGKKTINIEMPLLKLYNSNGDIVVDKEVLKVGQTFELTYLKTNKFNSYSNAMGKTFCIISVEFSYNGVGKMTIVGKEV